MWCKFMNFPQTPVFLLNNLFWILISCLCGLSLCWCSPVTVFSNKAGGRLPCICTLLIKVVKSITCNLNMNYKLLYAVLFFLCESCRDLISLTKVFNDPGYKFEFICLINCLIQVSDGPVYVFSLSHYYVIQASQAPSTHNSWFSVFLYFIRLKLKNQRSRLIISKQNITQTKTGVTHAHTGYSSTTNNVISLHYIRRQKSER